MLVGLGNEIVCVTCAPRPTCLSQFALPITPQLAEEMRKAINNCNTDIVKENPDYVVRVVSDEGQIGRGHLDRFMDVETLVPTVMADF